MWIQVRSIDGKKTVRVDNLSKLTKIEALRERLVDEFDAPAEAQRLFFRGKQLVDGHSLFDYNVGLNDLIQILTRKLPVPSISDSKETNGYASSGDEGNSSDKENQKPPSPELPSTPITLEDDIEDSTYKMGDIIDAQDISVGAWFEAKIVKITKALEEKTSQDEAEKKNTKGDGNNNESLPEYSHSNQKQLNDSTLMKQNGDNSGAENMECDTNVESKGKDSTDSATAGEKASSDDANGDSHDCSNSKSNSEGTSESSEDSSVSKGTLVCVLPENDPYLYHVTYEGYEDVEKLRSRHVRPRARVALKMADITVGLKVMANYNYDDPDERGFWYDCIVTRKADTRTQKQLWATVFIGKELTPLHDCKLLFVNEIFAIETPGTQLNEFLDANNPSMSPTKRKNKPDCDHCEDNPKRKCKHCACCVCGGKHDPDKQILCDECNQAYHLTCLRPALTTVPEEDEWYCPDCKVDDTKIVRAGEKLKTSKKKSKMASATSVSSRDWGKGMACVGRTKECTIVPPNHFGPVPGGEVGMMWKFRVQVSEAGVHRPHVAGIHGREDDGAFSIVLSGGYEDDEDWGEEFTYTGSGGRDLSGNKRTAEQSCDQKLTRMNRALAKNCNATINNKDGADAGDKWKGGKPVRVVRNCKGRKHSKYAPEEGNRYDGIYKIVKYWPEKGKSGFIVWRYLLRRDDPTPAPWTSAGKKRMRSMGFEMVYPEGYLEAQKEKERLKDAEADEETPKGKGRGKKRKAEASPESTPKKAKGVNYKIADEQLKLVKKDKLNEKLWKEALNVEKEGYQKFLAKVEEVFMCVCCQDLSYKPVTLECTHNVCKTCLSRSFKAEVYSCPACRFDLTKEFKMPVNQCLTDVLNTLFPGYEAAR